MKKFTCPCFVRITDKDKRLELAKWCVSLGYREIWVGHSNYVSVCENTVAFERLDSDYNCGDSVKLFKALAAMNDTDDYMQWLIRPDINEFWLCKDKDMSIGFGTAYRKATKEEIINYFKK